MKIILERNGITLIKSLFKASFEQSLNLLDVPISNVLGDKFKTKPITSKKVNVVLLLILFGFMFGMSFVSKTLISFNHNYNFLPMWLFALTVIMFATVVFYTIRKEYGLLKEYSQYLRLNIAMAIGIIYFLLVIIQYFLNRIPLYLLITGIVLIIGSAFLMIRHKSKHFYSVLYDDDKEIHNKSIKRYKIFGVFFYTVLPILLIIYYFFKWSKPDVLLLLDNFIGRFFYLVVCVILMIAALVYLMWPDLMIGYYKYKYSEEYRVFEGKSKEEWYGQLQTKL